MQLIVEKLKEELKDIEMFLFESPYNNYQPAPNKGEFVIRSHKRRLFLQLVNGRIPNNINELIKNGEYREEILA